jgi:hypothetical protein
VALVSVVTSFPFHGLKLVTQFFFIQRAWKRTRISSFSLINFEVGVVLQMEIRLNGSDESEGVASFKAQPSRNNSRSA